VPEELVDLEHVVVGGTGDHADPAAAELVLGHVDPPGGALDHDLLEALVDQTLVLLERGVLLVAHADRVVPAVLDAPFELPDLLLALEHLAVILQGGLPRAVGAPDDRDHGLAGDVAAQDDHVGLVEGAGVQELLPADLRPVQVGHEEDLHLRSPASTPYLRPAHPNGQGSGCGWSNSGAPGEPLLRHTSAAWNGPTIS
jgi:hypothetical protein